jgi:hypothetical protein
MKTNTKKCIIKLGRGKLKQDWLRPVKRTALGAFVLVKIFIKYLN